MSTDPPKILINKLHFPVTTLGPGKRIGVWFQGCSIQCPGCINPETWEFAASQRIEFKSLREVVDGWLPEADGLTISGGEPFDQPAALLALLEWHAKAAPDHDTQAFTGYDFAQLESEHPQILRHLDVVISGPYQETARHASSLSGSENQEIHLLSERGRQRYGSEMATRSDNKTLDVYAEENGLWFAGIPHAMDWDHLTKQLARHEVATKDLPREH